MRPSGAAHSAWPNEFCRFRASMPVSRPAARKTVCQSVFATSLRFPVYKIAEVAYLDEVGSGAIVNNNSTALRFRQVVVKKLQAETLSTKK